MIRILDTTVISALMRAEPVVSARLLALSPGDALVPQPVLAEVLYGLARLPSSHRRRALESRLELLLATLRRATWDDETSARFGATKADLERRGVRVEDFDVAIAAHALALDGIVVTENRKHFARIAGLRVESWGR